MKHVLYAVASAAILFAAAPSFAQNTAPTGIGYIPGMPVPQNNSTPAASSTPARSTNASGNKDGKISKVTVSGQQSANPAPAAAPAVPAGAPKLDAEYKGVTPSKRDTPENSATFTKTPGNQLSWIGFLPEEGTHKVFVQTSQATSFERIASAADRVEVRIFNTKLAVSNNQRELNMKYFQTPFARAKAVKSGKDVLLIVELKEATTCDVVQHDNFIDIVAHP